MAEVTGLGRWTDRTGPLPLTVAGLAAVVAALVSPRRPLSTVLVEE